ncbi:MAG: hypothetical protein MMC23_000460 [Stictis urceolatum]|nr:hypothetical protein [Stictis urceolata]
MLKRLGHDVHILEQHPSSVRQGQAAGISTGPYVKAFLEEHDHCSEPSFVMSNDFVVRNRVLDVKLSRPYPLPMTNWDTLYYRLRANFDGLSSDFVQSLPSAGSDEGEAFYDVGKRVVDLLDMPEDQKVEVKYESMSDAKSGSLVADLVLGADGANSKVRNIFLPHIKRRYADFVTWRGTVPEKLLSPETVELFEAKSNLYYLEKSYMIMYALRASLSSHPGLADQFRYIIPGDNGSVTPGDRLVNVAWYERHPTSSKSFSEIMTDTDGVRHYYTLPVGKIKPEVWERQRKIAEDKMAPPIREVILNIKRPFITAISDYESPQAAFLGGKVLLVGDALSLFRTHTAQSTSQAAKQCILLQKVMRKEMRFQEWEKEVLQFAHSTRLMSPIIGSFYMSNYPACLYWVLRYILAFLASKLGLIL